MPAKIKPRKLSRSWVTTSKLSDEVSRIAGFGLETVDAAVLIGIAGTYFRGEMRFEALHGYFVVHFDPDHMWITVPVTSDPGALDR